MSIFHQEWGGVFHFFMKSKKFGFGQGINSNRLIQFFPWPPMNKENLRLLSHWSCILVYSLLQLTSLDSEGRALLTEHIVHRVNKEGEEDGESCPQQQLVVVNVYCPMVDIDRGIDSDRLDFKLRFYAALQERCTALEKAGKWVQCWLILARLSCTWRNITLVISTSVSVMVSLAVCNKVLLCSHPAMTHSYLWTLNLKLYAPWWWEILLKILIRFWWQSCEKLPSLETTNTQTIPYLAAFNFLGLVSLPHLIMIGLIISLARFFTSYGRDSNITCSICVSLILWCVSFCPELW